MAGNAVPGSAESADTGSTLLHFTAVFQKRNLFYTFEILCYDYENMIILFYDMHRYYTPTQ